MQQFAYSTQGPDIKVVAKDTDIYGDEFWSDKPGKDRSLGSCSSDEKDRCWWYCTIYICVYTVVHYFSRFNILQSPVLTMSR